MKYKYQILYAVYILLFALFVNARQYRMKPVPLNSVKSGIDSTALILNFTLRNGSENCLKSANIQSLDFLTFMRDSLSSFKVPDSKKVIILDSYDLRARFLAYFFYVKYNIKSEIFLCNTYEE